MTDATVKSRSPDDLDRGDLTSRLCVPQYRPPSLPERNGVAGARRRSTSAEAMAAAVNLLLALILLAAIAPLMVAIAVAVSAHDGGPAFFAHRRIGRGGVPFKCFKFRSMCINAEERLAQHLAADPAAREEWRRSRKLRADPRITALGRFLRRSSLDELPQLINVVRGEMSLVGPRPIVDAEIAVYGRRFCHYASVKPGITGLWQVSGRSDAPYRTRIALDSLYARRRGVVLDCAILLRTVPVVLFRHGSC